MNVVFLIIPAIFLYVMAQRYYAPRLARALGEDDRRITPAIRLEDGMDYVPTARHIVFAHHFSAIAAAGPIVGPTMALQYGYVPTLLWIVVGAILIGAVHDYAAMYISIREDGRSIAEIARKILGKRAFILFALFIVFNLVVVNAVFVHMTAVSLTSEQPLSKLNLGSDQTIFRVRTDGAGEPRAIVGGIASSSAIALTAVAPVLGFLVIRRKMRSRYAYPLATALCLGSVLFGFAFPVSLGMIDLGFVHISPTQGWVLLISMYVMAAAAVPVWLILQPREFVSVQFLYLGIGLMIAALIGHGLRGHVILAPAENLAFGEHNLGSVWPTLFVTIACGAVSGFHGLVSSGTTSKQLMLESDARRVGYMGMLGESALALCVTLTIAAGISQTEYASYLIPPVGHAGQWQSNPVLAFSVGVAGVCESGLGIPRWLGLLFGLLMVEGFVLDTLDVSIRLNRYLLEEVRATLAPGWMHFRGSYWVDSGLSVGMMVVLAFTNSAAELWPIFGTGNQLLAALTLMTLSLWAYKKHRPAKYLAIPALVVGVTTFGSLVYLFAVKYWPKKQFALMTTDAIFFILAIGIGATGLWVFLQGRTPRDENESVGT